MEESGSRILLVDDDVSILKALQRALMDEDYTILKAQSGREALGVFAETPVKVIVCDEKMPEMPGSELLSIINCRYPETVRILLTGHATLENAMKAVNEGGIWRVFLKPWDENDLKLAIRSAIEKYDLEMKVRKLMSLVRLQQLKINRLRQIYADPEAMGRSGDGSYYIPAMSDEDVAGILRECQID